MTRRARSRILILGALAILATIAAFVVSLRPRHSETTPSGAASALRHVANDDTDRARTVDLAPVSTDDARSDRSSADPSSPIAERDGISVRVVLAATGEPLAGAEVLYLDDAAVDRFASGLDASGRLHPFEKLVDLFGLRLRTDTRGRARVPHPRTTAAITASHYGVWQHAQIGARDEAEVRLALEPDLALDVQLRGAPSDLARGTEVALCTNLEGDRWITRVRARADEHGRARFEHVALYARWARDHSTSLRVVAEILAAPEASALVDPRAWPTRPVEIALPPTGSVVFEFVGADGPLSADELDTIRRGGGDVDVALSRDQLGRAIAAGSTPGFLGTGARLVDGAAELAAVGLGLELFVTAEPPGWREHGQTFSGPTRAGERVVVPIVLANAATSIAGRLVDEDGRALAHRAFDAEFERPGTSLRFTERRTTDAEGRFVGAGNDRRLTVESWRVHFVLADEPERSALAELPSPMPTSTVDLGDVRVAPTPVLASGRVVDESSRPLRAVDVELDAVDVSNSNARWTSWKAIPRALTRTDVDGRFAIRSWERVDRVRARATRAEFTAHEPIEFAAPRNDLEIVLARGGALEGRLVLGARTARGQVRAVLHLDTEHVRWDPRFGADGSFRFEGLDEGSYTLRLTLANTRPGTHEIPGIVVRRGQTTSLGTIDLDPVSRGFVFDVRDAADAPIDDARFSGLAMGIEGIHEMHVERVGPGVFRFRSFESALASIRIDAPGFRSETLEHVDGDRRVVLRRGPTVRLALAGGLPAIPAPWALHVNAQAPGGSAPYPRFDASGEAVVALTQPGPWSIGVRLANPGTPGFRGLNGLEWTIDVRDQDGEQRFESPLLTAEFLGEIARATQR